MSIQDLIKNKKKENAVQYGPEQVDYGEAPEGEQCMGCRWFSMESYETPEGPGMCQLVYGEVMGNQGCKKFELNPTQAQPEEEEENPEEGETPAEDIPQTEKPTQETPVPQVKVKKNSAPAVNIDAEKIKTRIDVLREQHIGLSAALTRHSLGKQRLLALEIAKWQAVLQNDHSIQY